MKSCFLSRLQMLTVLLLVSFSLLVPSLWAEPPKKTVTIEGITEYQLDNGVRLLLFPDQSAATVTVNMTVLVGSRHEGYGETGMAHLLEHMLFKGAKEFPHTDRALRDHGASEFNGTTWVDRTNYFETMPATDKNLEFGIKFEADRLVNCFIKREDLAKEMTVVRNEFEMGENDPEMILSQRMMAVAYEWHNYGKSTIGNRSDIERVPIERLQEFYRKYYQPDNVMVVVAGKFDEQKALDYVGRYFGALKRPSRPLERTYTEEPTQDGERTVILRRVGKVAVVGCVYHLPAGAHPDFAALEVLDNILTAAPSGRLYKALVEAKKASRVDSSSYAWHDPGALEILARVSDKVAPEEVRDIMLDVLEKFATQPVTEEEVERAKRQLLAQRERALTNSKRITIELSEWAGAGDWRLLFVHRDRVKKVTPTEVSRVASLYLRQSNRTVGMFLPTATPMRAAIPPAPAVAELVKDYKGGVSLASGEKFDPTPENIEKRLKRLQLASGLKVALLPKKTRGEVVLGRLSLHFGNEQSLQGHNTASGFIGPMLTRGTKKHSRQEIQDLLDKIQAKLDVSSGVGDLNVSLQAKHKTLPALLDIMQEVLREPAFPEKEFEIIKRASKQSLEKSMVEPTALAFNALVRHLHPYAKDNIRYYPTFQERLERLEKTTSDQVAKVYQEQIGGTIGELVLLGDFEPEEALKKLEVIFSGWKSAVPYQRIGKAANVKVAGGKQDILTPDKEGAVFAGGLTLSLTDTAPEYPAMVLGNYLLGGSPTARLFERLRQEEGLSYGAGSRFDADAQDPYGIFYMYAICNPEVIDKADKLAMDVYQQTVKKGFKPEEFESGRKALLEEQKLQRANDGRLVGMLRDDLYLGRTMSYYAELEKRLASLGLEEVNRTVAAQLSINRLFVVRAGDFKKKK